MKRENKKSHLQSWQQSSPISHKEVAALQECAHMHTLVSIALTGVQV